MNTATTTRDRILEVMFQDIRRNGFQGLRADKVIADLGITKGALYHHFPGKQAIGMAVIDEIIRPHYLRFYRDLDGSAQHPIDKLKEHLTFLSAMASDEEIALGCPLNNLVQEMSPIDEDFRVRMKAVVDAIHTSIGNALRRGQNGGLVRSDIDPDASARFFFANIEGAYSIAKVAKNAQNFRSNLQLLGQWLDTLRT